MKIISIYSSKGGEGKSTLTVNLAGAYASQGERVVVVDTDEQESVHSIFHDVKAPSFDVMTSFPAKKAHDVMLIDHHPSHSQVPFGAFIIYPIKPCPLSLASYEKTRHLLKGKQHLLVVNHYDKRIKLHRDFVATLILLGYPPAHTIPSNPAFPNAWSKSETVFDARWNLDAWRAQKRVQQLKGLIS